MGFCDRCVFRGQFSDMGASAYTCELFADLCTAIKRYNDYHNSSSCPFALFYCDLIDAFSHCVSLPDDCTKKYAYLWSKELRDNSYSPFKFIVLKK